MSLLIAATRATKDNRGNARKTGTYIICVRKLNSIGDYPNATQLLMLIQ